MTNKYWLCHPNYIKKGYDNGWWITVLSKPTLITVSSLLDSRHYQMLSINQKEVKVLFYKIIRQFRLESFIAFGHFEILTNATMGPIKVGILEFIRIEIYRSLCRFRLQKHTSPRDEKSFKNSPDKTLSLKNKQNMCAKMLKILKNEQKCQKIAQ